MCGYRGNIHINGPPSRYLACCTHGRSHTRSPGTSIMRVDSGELPLSTIPLCQLLPCHFGPPRPMLSINLYVKGCLDCTIGAFHMSIPLESSLLQNELQILSSLDLVVTMSCGLTLQTCLIIALSFRCRHWGFGFVNGQVSLAWSIALCTQELYTWPSVLKERSREERTVIRSLNFFQAVFSHVAKVSYHLKLVRSDLDFLLWSAIQGVCSSLAPCTSVVRVLFQALEPTAFLVHPVLAAIAEDAVAAHSSATGGVWKLA